MADTLNTSRMAAGEPGLPERFRWRNQTLVIDQVLRAWKDTGPCTHGSGERYVRKHWFEVRLADGRRLKVYFERQARSSRQIRQRWWLFSVA